MAPKLDKKEGRPSAASTQAPSSGRPSAVTSLPSSGRPSAVQPLINEADSDPEITCTINVRPLSASCISNLAPANESHIGEPVDLPASFGSRGPENLSPEQATLLHEELEGLTSEEHRRRIEEYGRNEIPEIDTPWYILLGKQFVGVMPFMLEIAAIVSAVIPDWADFSIILAMLVLNALIGFHEEHKAKQSLDALKSQMVATVPVKRDGNMSVQPAAELVPGDVIFLRGGNVVPADCQWLEGDEMQVDTAALTGEPIPRKVPRPDRPDEELNKGKELLSGCIIKQGEGHCVVRKTGLQTEIGQAAGLVQEASGHEAGVFETKIMQVVKVVILIAIIDAAVLLYVQVGVRGDTKHFKKALLDVLAIVIGAVPIALPLVMQVTMAIGAKTMAKRKAIVTHLTALQEIASMTVLCSDKTGTLTTADMRVLPQAIWTMGGHTQEDALTWAGVASNDANKEDPIDSSILKTCQDEFKTDYETRLGAYRKTKFVGFNPTTKRSIAYCEHPERGSLKIAKGLTSKVLCTGEDGGDCWTVEKMDAIREDVEEQDVQFSIKGYKTLGVALAEAEGPMRFAAIVPMIDPPREDTELTIYRIRQAAINVKMITGDHLNIAVETSRLIGLGTGILPASDLWPASDTRDETIRHADGFAQVLPKDKREVILVLKQKYGQVVGMTGDGVNDAPALAEAQIGIAVDGATEAARSAADIILTEPGLSAIFDAVIESRKIFARLRAYVIYRMAATIQIVLVLSIMVYGYNVVMNPLYVILLALFNDISMLPIADDTASPSSRPEIPSLVEILTASAIYGGFLTIQSIGLFEFAKSSDWLDPKDKLCAPGNCDYITTLTYLQISIAIEFVIFSCRTPGFVFSPKYLWGDGRPSWPLFVGVMLANIIVTVFAGQDWIISKVKWADIGWIWLYNLVGLIVIDLLKVILTAIGLPLMSAGASSEVLGYPDLPVEEQAGGRSLVRSSSIMRTSMANSLVRSNRQGSFAGLGGATSSMESKKSSSLLPYPYNLRANVAEAIAHGSIRSN
mmetsp:Transcript_74956/g.117270  ORF Transcript_74956/g.117270 Transcript_74956/m.117270 type:complete len:1027 (+) Transcript_74956:67-3147(+)